MHLDFNPDNLDRYFKNQLSDADRQAMENIIAQDPLLKSEMHFQQEVVEAICQRRKWELKDRLNALAPESTPLFTVPRLAFGSTLVLASILTATLFWFDSKKVAQAPSLKENKPITKYVQKEKIAKPAISPEKSEKPFVQQTTPTVPTVAKTFVAIRNEAIAPQRVSTPIETPSSVQTTIEVVDERITQEMAIKLYDESLLFEVNKTDTDNGAFDRYSEDDHTLERMANSQMLRYQYYNGLLSLYNNTSAGKQIHVLIEDKMRHFLYYEHVYYEFYDGQFSETLMQPLRDANVIHIIKSMLKTTNTIK